MSRYVDEVAAELGSLSAEQRRAALDDLRAALADGATEEELGSPHDYAATVLDAYATDEEGEAPTVFGVPWETRGPTDPAVRSRIWDPADPRVLVPRMFGLGWTVNLGAVAVQLGLIRPDDWDDESLDAVDPELLTLLRFAPVVWAVVAVALSVRTWRRGLPVPTHWGRGGTPDRWSSPPAALVPAAIATGFAVWGTRRTTGDDRMIRPALASAGAALAVATALTAERSLAQGGGGPGPDVPATLAALVLPAQLAVPVAAALRSRRTR
ncbi:MAG: hypothetical protein HY829_00590 [Actinobacteria bacterium]|nr:hypothetical protein [Actinomycetota bacterium]